MTEPLISPERKGHRHAGVLLRVGGTVLFAAGLLSLLYRPVDHSVGHGAGGVGEGSRWQAWIGWAELAAGGVVVCAPAPVGATVLAGMGAILLGSHVWSMEQGKPCPCLRGVRERLGLSSRTWEPWMVAPASWFFLLGLAARWLGSSQTGPAAKAGRPGVVWGVVFACLAFWGLFWITGAWQQTVVGPDDTFELVKMLFLARHSELAHLAWNDQPWLHTLINARLLQWLGVDVLWPRLFQMVTITAFLVALGWMSRSQMGAVGLGAAALFLLANEHTFPLWFSVMLEPAALAWGCVAAAILYQPGRPPPTWRVVASGAVMAAAVHMKFTATVAALGLVTLVWSQYGFRAGLRMLPFWLAGFGAAFGFLMVLSPSFHWEWVLGAHWATRARRGGSPDWVRLLESFVRAGWIPLLLGALVGLWKLRRTRAPALVWWAVGMWAGAIAFASLAAPWWWQYELQWQIPLSCLAGWGMERLWCELRAVGGSLGGVDAMSGAPPGEGRQSSAGLGSVFTGTGLVALWLGLGTADLAGGWGELQANVSCVDPNRVEMLRVFADRVHWGYAPPDRGGELFEAGVCLPPELLVLSAKRSGSGAIDPIRVRILLQCRRPELLVLSQTDMADPLLMRWVEEGYVKVYDTPSVDLWVWKELDPSKVLTTDPRTVLLGPFGTER